MFKGLLEQVVRSTEGGIAALVMGYDGIPVDHYIRDDAPVDVETIGMEFSVILKDIQKAADMLEAGDVLIQYRELTRDGVGTLRKLAGDHVTVAPNPSLGTNIVARAWLYKMECARVDVDDLETFVDAHLEKVHAH